VTQADNSEILEHRLLAASDERKCPELRVSSEDLRHLDYGDIAAKVFCTNLGPT